MRRFYCSRGDMENRIKECQLDLHFGDDAALCSTIGYRRRHRDYPMSTHDTWYPAGGLSRCGKPQKGVESSAIAKRRSCGRHSPGVSGSYSAPTRPLVTGATGGDGSRLK